MKEEKFDRSKPYVSIKEKTMNTQEEKARFFAQYFNQNVWIDSNWGNDPNNCVPLNAESLKSPQKWECLLLTPLSAITDEDAIKLLQICYPYHSRNTDSEFTRRGRNIANVLNKGDFKTYTETPEAVDFLRSRGYALPFMGISVEEQIQRGWIKLRET